MKSAFTIAVMGPERRTVMNVADSIKEAVASFVATHFPNHPYQLTKETDDVAEAIVLEVEGEKPAYLLKVLQVAKPISTQRLKQA